MPGVMGIPSCKVRSRLPRPCQAPYRVLCELWVFTALWMEQASTWPGVNAVHSSLSFLQMAFLGLGELPHGHAQSSSPLNAQLGCSEDLRRPISAGPLPTHSCPANTSCLFSLTPLPLSSALTLCLRVDRTLSVQHYLFSNELFLTPTLTCT